jgi:mannose-6-phosphate isomerase-like protein (cupin superfamily)
MNVTHTVEVNRPSIKGLKLDSLKLKLFHHKETQLENHYLQKIDAEIHFLWTYAPVASEEAFAKLVLNYLFSETRIKHIHDFPFYKIQLFTTKKTYSIDKFNFDAETEKTKFGLVDTLYLSEIFGVYRLRIAPGHTIPPHVHHIMEEKEILLTDGLLLEGKPIQAGIVRVWPHKIPHFYENTTQEEQCILCIDQPPFDANDEVLV